MPFVLIWWWIFVIDWCYLPTVWEKTAENILQLCSFSLVISEAQLLIGVAVWVSCHVICCPGLSLAQQFGEVVTWSVAQPLIGAEVWRSWHVICCSASHWRSSLEKLSRDLLLSLSLAQQFGEVGTWSIAQPLIGAAVWRSCHVICCPAYHWRSSLENLSRDSNHDKLSHTFLQRAMMT